MAALTDFERFDFTSGSVTKTVFRRGSGPGVLLMHELPGLTLECIDLAERIAEAGLCVYVPLLFGSPGERGTLRNSLRICVSREFNLLRTHGRSPIVEWLWPLCRFINEERGGTGIGVVGMCLTGGLVLSMMLERDVIAAVASQPAVPMLAFNARRKAAWGIPKEHLAEATRRSLEESIDVLAWRFSQDPLCPQQRFDELRRRLGVRFRCNTIPSGRGTGLPARAHSTLTLPAEECTEPVREAMHQTIAFLVRSLSAPHKRDAESS